MQPTPPKIQERAKEKLGIPNEAAGYSKYPRNHTGIKESPYKRDFLILDLNLICNGGLAGDWGMRNWDRNPSHLDLAAATGQARESLTRRMSRVRGKRAYIRRKAEVFAPTLIHSKRRGGIPNIYTPALPKHDGIELVVFNTRTGRNHPGARYVSSQKISEQTARARADAKCNELNKQAKGFVFEVRQRVLDEKCVYYANNQQILDNPKWAAEFDRDLLVDRDNAPDFAGTADIPNYVWHSCINLRPVTRLLASYYFMCNVENQAIEPWQGTISRRLGISPGTITRSNRELERAGIFRVTGTGEHSERRNRWERRKNRVIYMPWFECQSDEKQRQISRHLAREVRKAFRIAWKRAHRARLDRRLKLRGVEIRRASEAKRKHEERLWAGRQLWIARRIFNEVLAQHIGGEQFRLHLFYKAVSNRMWEAGVDSLIIGALIPRIKGPP